MFIRKKKNKNGSCTILLVAGERVIGKKNPVTKTIRHFGTASTEHEIQLLVQQAETYKATHETLHPKTRVMRIASDLDIKSCSSYNTGFTDVYGKAFDDVFASLNLKPNFKNKLRELVVMRIAAPSSKLKTAQLASEYGMGLQVDDIYKLMDKLTTPVIEQIKSTVYHNTKTLLEQDKQKINVLFYDLTTVYFETSTQDEIRDFGFSKDGKHQHVQIMLALLVTTDGLLIDYQEFPGNSFEGHTLIPVLNSIRERYAINNVVLVADAALMSKINLQELTGQNIQYIIAARIKNTNKETKQAILDLTDYQVISTTTNDNQVEEITAKTIATDINDCLIAYHSTKRARKDAYDRQKDLDRIVKHVNSTAKSKLTGSLRKSYVKISKGCKIEINQEKLALEQQFDGFFGLRTNIADVDPLAFLSAYRGLWQVEQTFRIAKNSLEIRPVFHYAPRRIKAHFVICYMALALVRHVEFLLKKQSIYMPCEQFHLLLNRMRKINLVDHTNELFEIMEDPPSELAPIYLALKITWPKKFSNRPNL
jgi:transposase